MFGKNLSHYKILEELGRGGMGIVYKAEDTKLDRTVAIKVLPSAALASEDDRARFYREAKAAAQLHHPHIASVFEIDEAVPEGSKDDDLRPFIAMEYIEGKTLDAKIKEGPFKLEDAVRIASEIASALEAAHKKDIVHRDIKSQNVMLTEEGSAKVLDFGLAQTAQSTKLTRMGSTLGTIAYMSPEQARSEEVDRRTDIWSLGVVLYEMVAGKNPFPGDYEQAAVYSILNEDPEPLTAIRTGVPMELERIVIKCIAKDIKHRYQHADDLIADLESLDLAAGGVSALGTVMIPAVVTSTRQLIIRYAAALIAGAIITAIAIFVLGIQLKGDERTVVLDLRKLTIGSAREYFPDIHPNGDMVVYAAGDSYDDAKLYYKSVSGSIAQRLTRSFPGSENQPSFSPDGSKVLFLGVREIYVVDFPGGVPAPLVQRDGGQSSIVSASWGPDAERIAFTTATDSIFAHNIETRTSTFVALLREPHSVSWSNDGSYLAVVSENRNSDGLNVAPSSIYVVDIKSGLLTRITGSEYMNRSPQWSSDDKSLFFISTQGGGDDVYKQPLTEMKAPDGPAERITAGLNLHSIRLSKDSDLMVGGSLSYSQNIWASPIDAGRILSARDAVSVTDGDQIIEGIAVSPDGTELAYDSNVSGITNIYVVPINGGDPRRITNSSAPEFVFSWSEDGSELAYHTFSGGSRDVFTVSIADLSSSPVATDSLHENFPSWSADGSRIGFPVNVDGGPHFYISRRASDGSWGEPAPHSNSEIGRGQYSPIADLIAYATPDGLWIHDERNDTAQILVDRAEYTDFPTRNNVRFTWSADGKHVIFFAGKEGEYSGFWIVPVGGGPPVQFQTMDGLPNGFSIYSASRDLLYYTLREVQTDIWMMELESGR